MSRAGAVSRPALPCRPARPSGLRPVGGLYNVATYRLSPAIGAMGVSLE